jgi:hypothetical protein
MTKEDKIKEAYGEKYNPYNIDENGWMRYNLWMHFFKKVDDDYDEFDNRNMRVRPNSLIGIENNNGWIKIEEDGLINYNGDIFGLTKNKSIWFFAQDDFIEKGLLTHYQPVIKPALPLY